MIAVDTNVVVRLVTRDHPAQAARAAAIFRAVAVFIPKTVLLEAEWVLRRAYGYDAIEVVRALRALMALPNVEVEDARAVADALTASESGFDFADALHLASCTGSERFVTFDRRLVAQARGLAGVTVELA